MATSGSVDFTVTRNEIIHSALRLCGAYSEADSDSSTLVSNAATALNIIAKSWMADGMQVWLRDTAVVFLNVGDAQYSLKPSGDHATNSHTKTEIRVAGVATDTTIEVDSTTGISASDYIGIELTSGVMHWTTVSSITDSDTLVIASGLPSAAAVDNHVYAYTTRLTQMPYAVLDAYIRSESDIDTIVSVIPRGVYNAVTDKSTQSTINQIYYERKLATGELFVWPTPDSAKERLYIEYQREVEDFDSENDSPDFPKHFFRALKFQLAADLAPEFGLSIQRMSWLNKRAEEALEKALGYDKEGTYIELKVDTYGG